MLHQKSFLDILNVTSSQGSESGAMRSDSQGGPTIGQSGPDHAHASLSARQAKEKDLMTSGTYGLPSIGSSNSADLSESLGSRLQEKQASLGSTLYRQTWKVKAMPSGRLLLRLVVSAHRTKEKDSIGLRKTPVAPPRKSDGDGGPRPVKMLPSGKVVRYSKKTGQTFGLNLADEMKLASWQTPQAMDASGKGRAPRLKKDFPRDPKLAGSYRMDMKDEALLANWPTPTKRDYKDTTGMATEATNPDGSKRNRLDQLGRVVGLIETQSPARLTVTGEMLTGSSAEMESGGQLNPAHSRWLMGLPSVWDVCGVTAMQSLSSKRKRS